MIITEGNMSFTIIDCHTHVYPDKIALRAVESIGSFYGISMHLDGTVGTLLQASQEAGVEKCLVHSAPYSLYQDPEESTLHTHSGRAPHW